MTERIERCRNRPPSGERVDPRPPALRPAAIIHEGRYCRLEPLDPRVHADDLYAASNADETARKVWDYLPTGPYPTLDPFVAYLRDASAHADPLAFAIRDKRSGQAGGMARFLNIQPIQSSIEIGHIWFGPALQNTAVSTEALYLMMREAMEPLGYRRLEWKCDALNRNSRQAALRLGFTFEGIFYQHRVVKDHNRDTAWFSILDTEWPAIRSTFETWLAPANFNNDRHQRAPLGAYDIATKSITVSG